MTPICACASNCCCACSLFTLPDELLEQLAPFRADALLQLVHDLFRRHRATETGSIGASLPTPNYAAVVAASASRVGGGFANPPDTASMQRRRASLSEDT